MTIPIDQSFTPRSDFLRVLLERGFIHQCTDMAALDARLLLGPVAAYNGFDLTADSLHVGHLIPIMMLRWLQRTGHKPVVLMGGGTTRIGDPSFRDTSRPFLDDAEITSNLLGIRRVFERFFDFGDGPGDAVMVNNADWLDDLRYINFLRDFGRHFSVNRMLGFDSVRQRLEREQSLSLLEFNYMVLQAYDFLELSRTHGCALQLGASDQWGNIVNGVELGRRVEGVELFGLTAPLLTTSSGAKMGKSANGAVWLDAARLSSYDFWQFWRNTEDANVGRFLRLFTDLPLDEIARLEVLEGAEINVAKKALAGAATALVHGEEAARNAADTARRTFEQGAAGGHLPTLRVDSDSIPIVQALTVMGFAASNGEARRKIGEGAVRLNDLEITDPAFEIVLDDVPVKISLGKKRHGILTG